MSNTFKLIDMQWCLIICEVDRAGIVVNSITIPYSVLFRLAPQISAAVENNKSAWVHLANEGER